MGRIFGDIRGRRRGHVCRPRVEAMEERVLFSFVVDPVNTTISASAGAGGSFQQVSTNPAHAQDSSSFAGDSFQAPYARSAAANASYQAAALQLTLHADATESDHSSFPISDAQASITLYFSLSAASIVQFNGTLTGTGGGASSLDLDSFANGSFPLSASSGAVNAVHQALNLSAGNYAIDFSAGCNSGDIDAAAAVTLTVTLGAATPPKITSANAATFQIGKPSAFTVTTSGNPTPSIAETAILPAGITFVDNGNGTATLSGTPSALDASGHYDLIFTASNGVSIDATHPKANQFFTLTLSGAGVKPSLPATHLVFGAQPANTTAGATMAPVKVLIEDKTGHVVTSDSSTVVLTLAGTAGGILHGTAAIQAAGGVATFSDLSLTKAGSFTLAAADSPLKPARSRIFKVMPDASTAHLILSQSLPASAPAAKPLPPISTTLEDQFGNIIKNNRTAVTLLIVSGPANGALKGKVKTPFVNGVAAFRNIRLSPAGAYTLELTDSALPGNGSLPLSLAITLV
jgi:hypothetical protein